MIRSVVCAALLLTISCRDPSQEAQAEPPKTGKEKPAATIDGAQHEAAQPPPVQDEAPSQPAKPATGDTPPGGKIENLRFTERAEGLPASGPFAGVALADLDGDGKAELLSGRRDEEQGLFLFSFKEGTWASRQITEQGDYGGVALADITGDGVPDLLAVKTAGRPAGLELFETKREGSTLSFSPIPSPYTDGSDDLDVGDIDGDGDIDIVVSSRGDRVLLNGGDGRTFEKIELDSGVYEDTGIVLADVNADQLPDVLSANHPGENVRLFLCESSKPVRFGARRTAGLPLDKRIGFKIAAADVNSDGHTDLAVGTQAGLRLFHGNSCQGPEETWWNEAPLSTRGSQTIQPVLADLDRDGHVDLVYTSENGLHVRLNDGGGQFGARLVAEVIPSEGSYSGACLADWDQDGDLDVAFSSFQGNGLHLLVSQP